MNIKLRAFGQVMGSLAIGFSIMSGLNYFFKEYAPLIFICGLMVYLIYTAYELRVYQLEFDEKFPKE
jgi:hypothetical protein